MNGPLEGARIGPTLLLAAAFLAVPLTAWSEPPPTRGPRHPGGLVTQNAERLGLDVPTLEAIRKVVEASGLRSGELRTQLQREHQALRELLAADAPDEQAAMQRVEAIGALEVELRKNRVRSMIQIRNLLTPSQRAELVEMRRERPHRRKGTGPGPPR